jgi:hypothetical protein
MSVPNVDGRDRTCTAGRTDPSERDAAWNDELGHRIAQVERGEARLLTEQEFFADEQPAH